jgi:hypothetical protein
MPLAKWLHIAAGVAQEAAEVTGGGSRWRWSGVDVDEATVPGADVLVGGGSAVAVRVRSVPAADGET